MPRLRSARTELGILAEAGRAILEAEPDEDRLCELILHLSTRVVPTKNFQLGLFDGDRYQIKVWVLDAIPFR